MKGSLNDPAKQLSTIFEELFYITLFRIIDYLPLYNVQNDSFLPIVNDRSFPQAMLHRPTDKRTNIPLVVDIVQDNVALRPRTSPYKCFAKKLSLRDRGKLRKKVINSSQAEALAEMIYISVAPAKVG